MDRCERESRRQQWESFVSVRTPVRVIRESIAAMLKVSQEHRSEALVQQFSALIVVKYMDKSTAPMFHSSTTTSLISPTAKPQARHPAIRHERSLTGKACPLVVVTLCRKEAKTCATTFRNTTMNKYAQKPSIMSSLMRYWSCGSDDLMG